MQYLKVFLTGGLICVIGQILIDKTKLTPARILVFFVTAGVILTGLGIYQYIVDFGGTGATVPISGFGYCLATGVIEEVEKEGAIGIFTGGIKAAAGGISAAIIFGYLFALISKPDIKDVK
ncbi:MAG: stage V sporulation protein AE [Clostridia bacterium]|nr:stage V sporulation protein AE [Clostridia bacterium]